LNTFAPRPSRLPAASILFGLIVFTAAVIAGTAPKMAAGLVVAVAFVAVVHRSLTRWHSLVGVIAVVILLVPIKRYEFKGVSLPLDLEPYRVTVGIVIVLWISSLLIDSRVRLRLSGLEPPLLLLGCAILGSIVTNFDRITALELATNVTKELLFLASFFLVFYFVVSVIRSADAIHRVLETLVLGGAVVAFFAIIERRTGYNLFNHLQSAVPILEFKGGLSETGSIARAGRLRTYASAQHPIALAALFVMILPFALYLAHYTGRRIWAGAAVLIGFASLATVSRTSITMLATVAVVLLWLRPVSIQRFVPLLLPALIVVHVALPGVIGGLRQSFFPPGGLVADQTEYGGRLSGRRLGPQFEAIGAQPAFGQGYGTRVTTESTDPFAARLPEQRIFTKNARILDNQWLGTTVETGLIGFFAWIWLFGRFLRRTARGARSDRSARGWLLTAFTASTAAAAVGMFTYDTFSFIQVTFVLYFVLALGASTLMYKDAWPEASRRPGRADRGSATIARLRED
jgi:O-antigen ligase